MLFLFPCSAKVDERIRAVGLSRQEQYEALAQEQQAALRDFDVFQKSYDANLQDLSMREGLGQKCVCFHNAFH